jgi:formylglycine-generating enzyme required for sulfatase activity
VTRVRRLLPLLPAALAVLVVLPLVGRDEKKPKGKKYALLVGVKEYDHARLGKLRFTENDVKELAEVLQDRSAGFTSVRLLATAAGEKREADKPTAANIRAALKELLAKKTRRDTVLVAFSGHGIQLKVKDGDKAKEKDEAFFCPSDAQVNDPATLIRISQLFKDLGECGAGVKLLLVDACRNELEDADKSFDNDYLPKPARGTVALFSCASGQKSYETTKLGRGHGVFFHFVLEGLRGKAKNEDGTVTWQDLTAYVQRQVPRAAVKVIGEGAQQSPEQIGRITSAPVLVQENEPTEEKAFTNSIGMKLVLIPRGKFKMGSPEDEKVREFVEKGSEVQHEVEITKPFYLGIYTVTQKQYKEVMDENPSWFSAEGGGKDKVKGLDNDDFPVENVLWEQAKKFCEKLSGRAGEKRHGRVYHLPTEAEWEYSCRGGASCSNPFHFGKSLSSRQANFNGNYPYGEAEKGPYLERTCKVGSYKPNKFGLYDMHGNVWQWCSDWYSKDYYKDSPAKDPKGPDSGDARVLRGGSWEFDGRGCRAGLRYRSLPSNRSSGVGFRVACSPASRTP